MLGRLLKFGLVFCPIGILLVYFTSLADNQQPWIIGFAIYFILGAIVGNLYVFMGGQK